MNQISSGLLVLKPKNDDLNELMLSTIKHGQIRVSRIATGWYASIEMNTAVTGAKFEIASEFKCLTPVAAVQQCIERMHIALKQLGVVNEN